MSRKKRPGSNSQFQSTLSPPSAKAKKADETPSRRSVVLAGVFGVCAALAGTGLTVIYQSLTSGTRLGGQILLESYGPTLESGPDRRLSLVIYLTMANLRDTAVSPVDYTLELEFGGQAIEMRLRYDQIADFRIVTYDGTDFGLPGPLRIRFPLRHSLLTTDMTSEITRAKGRAGILWFNSVNPVSDTTIRSAPQLRLFVVDSSGTRHEMDRPVQRRHDYQVLKALEPTAVFERGPLAAAS